MRIHEQNITRIVIGLFCLAAINLLFGCVTYQDWQLACAPKAQFVKIEGAVAKPENPAQKYFVVSYSRPGFRYWGSDTGYYAAIPLDEQQKLAAPFNYEGPLCQKDEIIKKISPQQRKSLLNCHFKYESFQLGEQFVKEKRIEPLDFIHDDHWCSPLDPFYLLSINYPTANKGKQAQTENIIILPKEISRPARERLKETGKTLLLTPADLCLDALQAPFFIVMFLTGTTLH